jgi:class 3 adenylate cyclase
MAAKGKTPLAKPPRTIAELEAELARRTAERDEALAREGAIAEVLRVVNSSSGDLAPVFDAILGRALNLCGAALGYMLSCDGESFYRVASRGSSPALEAALPPPGPTPGSLAERFVRGENIICSTNLVEDNAYRIGAPSARALVDLGGVRSYAAVALRSGARLLGIIAIYRREVQPFSDTQIALLQNFAAHAVIAMENARLLTETREALEQQTATAEVLQVINASPGELAPVFDAMLEKAMHLCEAVYGMLFTYDGERFHAVALRGEPLYVERLRQLSPFRPEVGVTLQRIVRGDRLVHVADVLEDDSYRRVEATDREGVQISGIRTLLTVALRKEDTLLGTLSVYRREVRPFSDKQIALLQNFAAQAVIAMENARLLGELRQRTDEVAELNRGLEARVAEQVEELGRVGRLKRFLAPQLAELIVSQGDEKILESHRREIVVVFCDLRGYTAFTETAEPEEVLDFLRQYHGALGPLVSQFEGTLDQFSGDGIMVFFNDPVPCPNPAERAVKMAMAMREEAGKLITTWRRDGCALGFGAGIAQGYATLGQIGFSERSGYTAIGTVCNLAARLCAEAKDGQILISSRVARAVEPVARLEDLGNLELKGLRRPVAAFNVVQSTSSAEARPNLTVVAKGPGV